MGNLKKGFARLKEDFRVSYYWVALYSRENEDEPFSVTRTAIFYRPGEDRMRILLNQCHTIFEMNPDVWEVLVHKGPDATPSSGEQIVARLSRERFDGSEELVVEGGTTPPLP